MAHQIPQESVAKPQIGDRVEAVHLVGATLTWDYGTLAVELGEDEHVSAVVLEGDGSATRIDVRYLVSLVLAA